jgi:twitching motility protein PilT
MRDVDTMDQVMRAGETGHLVLTTMHADDILSAVGRLVGSYPQNEQPRVRQALAATLSGIVYQRLLPRTLKKGAAPGSSGRVPAVETLYASMAVKTILRSGDWSKLGSYLGRATGGVGYKECLSVLAGANAISEDTRREELLRLQSGI